MEITIFQYSCSCTVTGCQWQASGTAPTQKEADSRARGVLRFHLLEMHGIAAVRTRIQRGRE